MRLRDDFFGCEIKILAGERDIEVLGDTDIIIFIICYLLVDRVIYIDLTIYLYIAKSVLYNVVVNFIDRMIVIGRGEFNNREIFIRLLNI